MPDRLVLIERNHQIVQRQVRSSGIFGECHKGITWQNAFTWHCHKNIVWIEVLQELGTKVPNSSESQGSEFFHVSICDATFQWYASCTNGVGGQFSCNNFAADPFTQIAHMDESDCVMVCLAILLASRLSSLSLSTSLFCSI